MRLLLRWFLNAFALWLTIGLIPGLSMSDGGLWPLLLTALVLGLVNAIVRPVMILLTLPFTLLTFGLFLLVVNALALGIVAALTPLQIAGFGTAVVAALVLTIIAAILGQLIPDRRRNGRVRR